MEFEAVCVLAVTHGFNKRTAFPVSLKIHTAPLESTNQNFLHLNAP